jgi:hypothetical protein
MRYSRLIVVALGLVVLCASFTEAAKWSSAYIRQLPDSAFAVVETSPNGKPIRRLPHHDARGDLDLPHLCNAIARLGQVKWRDPANAEIALRHLRDHLDQIGRGACHPAKAVER